MIEENVAIICACLPMCRTPLGFIFPTIFGTTRRDTHYNYPTNSTNRSRSRHGDWVPYSGSRKGENVTLGVHEDHDNISEEYILNPYHQPAHAIVRGSTPGTIRKTTQYEVVYERGPAGKRSAL